jgi:hypothetical protein
MLFLVSFLTMIYHYSNTTNLTFEASIGDRITKLIEIDNFALKKIKYVPKIMGSQDFQMDQKSLILLPKGRTELKVTY